MKISKYPENSDITVRCYKLKDKNIHLSMIHIKVSDLKADVHS